MSLLPPLFFWYIQDFFQALFGSWTLAPDVYFVFMMTLGLSDEENFHRYVWGCFLGGLLWDLRWTGIPGFCASIYSLLFTVFRILWFMTPKEGRLPAFFFGVVFVCVLIVSVARGLLFSSGGDFPPGALAVFSLSGLICVSGAWLCYSRFYRSQNV